MLLNKRRVDLQAICLKKLYYKAQSNLQNLLQPANLLFLLCRNSLKINGVDLQAITDDFENQLSR